MNNGKLVAAMVLRVGNEFTRGLTWAELASVFNVTKDQMRHRLNKFKERYNIIDSEVVEGWNREFLKTNYSEGEKIEHKGVTIGDWTSVLTSFVYNVSPNKVAGVQLGNDTLSIGITEPRVTKDKSCDVITQETKSMPALQFLVTPLVLVVIRDGQPLSIDKTHKYFDKIEQSLKDGDWQKVLDLIDMKTALSTYSNGRVVIEQGQVMMDGKPIHGKLSARLLTCLLEENLQSLEALSNFMVKCDENPDMRVVERIYDFIAHNDLRLDAEGNILAYKIVKSNYLDKYTGTMDNSPTTTVSMKRNLVNPKDEETCSTGLHICAKGYLSSYGSVSNGDKVVLCQVDPKNFVSIPTDYNSMKARVCEYIVLKDVTENFRLDEGIS